MSKEYIGRIAPTPSGYLHIGHAKTFNKAYQRAKLANGKIYLRVEDIDTNRCKDIYVEAILKDLKKLGYEFDYPVIYQSQRFDLYWENMLKLIKAKKVYPCNISRSKIKDSAKKSDYDENEYIFPESLRNQADYEIIKNINWRFKVDYQSDVEFQDKAFGKQKFTAGKDFGDFIVWRKDCSPSYELAVVSDDIDMKISEVVRGADLLLSTAKQILLYKALNAIIPEFYHCELVLDKNSKKLSKSTFFGVRKEAGFAEGKFPFIKH